MKLTHLLTMQSAQEWHAWLEENHQQVREVWLVYYRAGAGKTGVSYDDSLDEALCFGWIDSLIQRIDEETYARKFTPRSNTAKWSDSNKVRVARLIRAGRMTPAGFAKLGDLPADGTEPSAPQPRRIAIPPEIEVQIQSNPTAWENYNKLPPSRRRLYIGWATSAKKAETVARRMKEVIEVLEQNKPLGQK